MKKILPLLNNIKLIISLKLFNHLKILIITQYNIFETILSD